MKVTKFNVVEDDKLTGPDVDQGHAWIILTGKTRGHRFTTDDEII